MNMQSEQPDAAKLTPYEIKHTVTHLKHGGREESVHRLLVHETDLGTNYWFAEHERHGLYDEYREDIAIARSLAAHAVDRDLAEERPAIAREIRYALMEASVESLVKANSDSPTPPVLLRALVEAGIWEPSEALDRIRAVDNYQIQVEHIATLMQARRHNRPLLSEQDVAQSWALLFPPKSRRAYEVAGRLLPRLPKPEQERITGGLLRLGLDPDFAPEFTLRARLLGMLGECLGPANLNHVEILDRVVDAVLDAEDDEEETCAALIALVPHVPHAMVVRIHQRVAGHPHMLHSWGLVHRALALRLAAAGTHLDWVAQHLTRELFFLKGYGNDLARRPTRDTGPVCTLLKELKKLDEPRCTRVLDKVLESIAKELHWGIAHQLVQVSEFLSGPDVATGLAIARGISSHNYPGARAQALAALLPAVPQSQRRQLTKEVLQALPRPGASDDHNREDTLRMLASHCSESAIGRVRKMIGALETKDQAEPLAILASRTPGRAGAQLRQQAVDIATRHDGVQRAEILQKIAPHLEDHQTRIQAIDLVSTIGYRFQSHRDRALDALVASTRNKDELEHARRAAERISDHSPQASALAALAGQVADNARPPLRRRVEKLLVGLPPEDQADILIALAVTHPVKEQQEQQDMLRRAADLITVKRGTDDFGLAAKLEALSPWTQQQIRDRAEYDHFLRFVTGFNSAGREPRDPGFIARLKAVRPVLNEKQIRDWLVTAIDLWSGPGWEGLDIWVALAPPEATDTRLLKSIGKLAQKKLDTDHKKAQYIAMTAPFMDGPAVSGLTSVAEQLHERVRDLPLAALVHRLHSPRRERVIAQILADMCDEKRDGGDGPISYTIGVDAHAVAALAQAMTESEREELLNVVLPRLNRARQPMDLLAGTLPWLSDQQRTRALQAGAAMLPERVSQPGEDFSAVAFQADTIFHQKLIEATQNASDDIKSRAIAAVLSSPQADPTVISWNNSTANRPGPVRELLNGLARPGMLTVLRAAAPHIKYYGGQVAAQECANAIQRVTTWWP
jgi:hypothetical protein